jgi:hypothetical protein
LILFRGNRAPADRDFHVTVFVDPAGLVTAKESSTEKTFAARIKGWATAAGSRNRLTGF